jgi:hypothetical protein
MITIKMFSRDFTICWWCYLPVKIIYKNWCFICWCKNMILTYILFNLCWMSSSYLDWEIPAGILDDNNIYIYKSYDLFLSSNQLRAPINAAGAYGNDWATRGKHYEGDGCRWVMFKLRLPRFPCPCWWYFI